MQKKLENFQDRVVLEKSELDEKLKALSKFVNEQIFMNLPFAEQDRLLRQRSHMEAYSSVLGQRIAAFRDES